MILTPFHPKPPNLIIIVLVVVVTFRRNQLPFGRRTFSWVLPWLEKANRACVISTADDLKYFNHFVQMNLPLLLKVDIDLIQFRQKDPETKMPRRFVLEQDLLKRFRPSVRPLRLVYKTRRRQFATSVDWHRWRSEGFRNNSDHPQRKTRCPPIGGIWQNATYVAQNSQTSQT